MDTPREQAVKIFNAALKSADPYSAVAIHADAISSFYKDRHCSRLYVVGFGKASVPMARALTDGAGAIISGGIIIAPYGQKITGDEIGKIKVCEARHPLPDENGMKAAAGILSLLKDLDDRALVVCLISGGGSALLVSPCSGITLEEKQETTGLLLKAGASIHELNAVRKHLSDVKGGRLAMAAHPAHIISLILSDVIGDSLDVIASGPTSPDSTTYADALEVIKKYGIDEKVPVNVINVLNRGLQGIVAETPKEGNPVFEKVENTIIGGNKNAIEAARTEAVRLEFDATVISAEVQGEAADAGRWLAKKAIEIIKRRKGEAVAEGEKGPVCLVSGGETTVTVTGSGFGGRNTELALAYAMEIEGEKEITFLSAGTDGADGPTDAAGAIVDGNTVKRAKAMGIDPGQYLKNNDSYNFFKTTGDLFITGLTGTNVMDIQVALIL
ncbi:MAG TPA: glycerate kinase [Syntrophorhabdaceae bacterium]|nr:glycerate kinase [Syntrophorhabdaceae bacterium]HQM82573.1 glycerate kinase [Syntrophorhabdaceae bacterium]